jgi:predicted nucleotidyltransferase
MELLLPIEPEALRAFCQKHHIRRLSVFGSVLKGTGRPDSDIDLLVDFETGHVPGLLALASMEIELSEMIGGRKVDLRTASDLSRYFRDEVVRTARVEYAA